MSAPLSIDRQRKEKGKEGGNRHLLRDLPKIFFSCINFGLSIKRGKRSRYQVCLLEALWFHFSELESSSPHASSLLSRPATSDLTSRWGQSGPHSYFLLSSLRASSFYFLLHTSPLPFLSLTVRVFICVGTEATWKSPNLTRADHIEGLMITNHHIKTEKENTVCDLKLKCLTEQAHQEKYDRDTASK